MNKLNYIKTQFCVISIMLIDLYVAWHFFCSFEASGSRPSLQWNSELFQQVNFLVSGKWKYKKHLQSFVAESIRTK